MNKELLTVDTKTELRGHVRVWADAVLYNPPAGGGGYANDSYTQRYQSPCTVYAMSLIGSEQALRAIAAGCCQPEPANRTQMEFRALDGGACVKGIWGGEWNTRAQTLTHGAMHMVAMPLVSVAKNVTGKVTEHVIIPPDPSPESLHRAVYERLLFAYSTPLIPLDGIEADDGMLWCKTLVPFILRDNNYWTKLRGHPNQANDAWDGAGLLRLNDKQLDAIVCEMIKKRKLVIPPAIKRAAVA